MRILFVSPFLPYPGVPHAGGKLIFYLLSVLSNRHSIVLLTRVFPGEEIQIPLLSGMFERVETIRAPGPIRPHSIRSFCETVASYLRLGHRAKELLRSDQFDLCQVEYTETAFFSPSRFSVPAVLTCHDVIAKPAYRTFEKSDGIARIKSWVNWRISLAIERHAVSKFSRILVLSEEDEAWAKRLYPGKNYRVLRYPAGVHFKGIPRKPFPGRVLFVGALNRPQNCDALRFFIQKVWSAVLREVPVAEFCVVGAGMEGSFMEELATAPRVIVVGQVPDVEPYYASAAVFVAPILSGGGVIVKVLDALAAGVPTVTTRYGNEGIRARGGEEIVVADNPDRFAEAVIRFLRDPGFGSDVGAAGRKFVEENFSPAVFEETLERGYRELVSQGGSL